MNDRDLPGHLKTRVIQYIDLTYTKSKDSYGADIDLPRTISLRIAECQYRSVIETCTGVGCPLRGCNDQFMNSLLVSLREVRTDCRSRVAVVNMHTRAKLLSLPDPPIALCLVTGEGLTVS